MHLNLKEEYLNILLGSIPTKTRKVIERRFKLLSNLKDRNQDKILFNQENEWRTLGLGYNSKRVLEKDINFLEKAKNILKCTNQDLILQTL